MDNQKPTTTHKPPRDERGWAALHWRVYEQQWDEAADLISQGADLHATDEDGESPVWIAVRNGDEYGFEFFRKQGFFIQQRNRDLATLLHAAVEGGSESVVEGLCEMAAQDQGDSNWLVDSRDAEDQTPLHHLAKNRDGGDAEAIARLMLDLGASPALQAPWMHGEKHTAAMSALIHFNVPVADVLVPALPDHEINGSEEMWANHMGYAIDACAVNAVKRILEVRPTANERIVSEQCAFSEQKLERMCGLEAKHNWFAPEPIAKVKKIVNLLLEAERADIAQEQPDPTVPPGAAP